SPLAKTVTVLAVRLPTATGKSEGNTSHPASHIATASPAANGKRCVFVIELTARCEVTSPAQGEATSGDREVNGQERDEAPDDQSENRQRRQQERPIEPHPRRGETHHWPLQRGDAIERFLQCGELPHRILQFRDGVELLPKRGHVRQRIL